MANAERQQKWRDRQKALRERYVTGAGIDREAIRKVLAEIARRRSVPGPDLPSWAQPEAILGFVVGELDRMLEGSIATETALRNGLAPGATKRDTKAIKAAPKKLGEQTKAEARETRELADKVRRGEVSPQAAFDPLVPQAAFDPLVRKTRFYSFPRVDLLISNCTL